MKNLFYYLRFLFQKLVKFFNINAFLILYKDILIIGSGDKFKKIDEAVPRWLIKKKISFEILPTVFFLF